MVGAQWKVAILMSKICPHECTHGSVALSSFCGMPYYKDLTIKMVSSKL